MSNFNELLEEYASIRVYIEEREEEIKPFKAIRDKIQAALQAQMNELGMTSAKSTAGHAVGLATASSVKVEDAELFFNWVFEQGDDSFLQKRANATAVEDYVKTTNTLPPGVTMQTVTTLRFTRSKTK